MLARRTALKALLMAGVAGPGILRSLPAAAEAAASLKQAFKDDFLVGAALNTNLIMGQDPVDEALVKAQFDSISPENCLKWENVHPEPGRYDFTASDRYVELGQQNGMYTVGHVLVWHSQTPDWVFREPDGKLLTREALLKRMEDHIHTVVGRYKGRIKCWDVVNEAVAEDGAMRKSLWYKIIGGDYVEKAFRFAHEADPACLLNYNDYSIVNPLKRRGTDKLITTLLAEKVPVGSIGLQGHYRLEWPALGQLDKTMSVFGDLGLKVPMTELDIDVLPRATNQYTADVALRLAQDPALNPYAKGLPERVQKELAERYAELFRIFVRHRGVCNRVTFWGVSNGGSWLNNWPIKGRTSYPLLFDRARKPTPAYYAVLKTATP